MIEKIKIKVEGMNLYRLVDRLVLAGVCLLNLKIKPYVLTCEIDSYYFDLFKNVCKKERKDFKIVSRFGIKNVFGYTKKLLGFLLAVVIAGSYLFSFQKMIFKLNISYSSADDYDLSKVVHVLNENGVNEGSLVELSAKEIESILIKNVDDIVGCRVIKDGSVLSICVYPEIKNNQLEKSLSSKYDAVITKIEVFSGSALKRVGDVVRVGDLLIESDTQASGVIEGKVYFSVSEIYNEKQQIVKFTGRSFCNREFKILQKTIAKDMKTNNYSQYLTKNCIFSLNNNLFIPIICEEEIVYEVEIEDKIIPFLEKESEIKNRLFERLVELSGMALDEGRVSYSVVRDGSYVRVDCFVEIEMSLI